MTQPDDTQKVDSTERVEDLTETWEESPLTEPDVASDPQAKPPVDSGFTDDSKTDPQRENEGVARTDD
jgi:hypothetical protein